MPVLVLSLFVNENSSVDEGLPELRNMHIIGIISYKIQKERYSILQELSLLFP